jgi:hypothetical protein
MPPWCGEGIRWPRHVLGRPHIAEQHSPCHGGKDSLPATGQGFVPPTVPGGEGTGARERVGDGPGVALLEGFGTFSGCSGALGETGMRVQWFDIAAGDLPRPPEKWADEALSEIEEINSGASEGGLEAVKKGVPGRPPDEDLCDTTVGSGESDKGDGQRDCWRRRCTWWPWGPL